MFRCVVADVRIQSDEHHREPGVLLSDNVERSVVQSPSLPNGGKL